MVQAGGREAVVYVSRQPHRTSMKRRHGLRRISDKERRRREQWKATKQGVLRRAGHRCQRCNEGRKFLHVHHVIPRARGGKDEKCNLVALCWACHRAIHDHRAEDWERWIA